MSIMSEKENALLKILCGHYQALFIVDLNKDIVETYHMSEYMNEIHSAFFEINRGYEETLLYFSKHIFIEDKEDFNRIINPDFIREELKDKNTFFDNFRIDSEGTQTYYRIKISKLSDDSVERLVMGFVDVTAEMHNLNRMTESQEMLKYLEKDKLTGLYSREFFFKYAKKYIEDNPNMDYILWTSDIQGLKIINEKYGIDKGDELLKTMAAGSNCLDGYIMGGRVDGDKLCALMFDNHDDYSNVKDVVSDDYEKNLPIPNVIIKNGVYHISKNENLSMEAIYDRTILAIQSIKNKYGFSVVEYDDKLRKEQLVNRLVIEDAKEALEGGQFKVYYQPKIDVVNKCIGGAEALVRWIHPEIGFMNPGVFIPIFEQNGFISKLDYYVWEEVCKSIVEWQKMGLKQIPVSVNVSRRNFDNNSLADDIISLVDKYGIEHTLFELEITETSYSDNHENVEYTIKKLHEAGFSISLDDFGTGYSSMIALSKLDLDILKMDMSLIKEYKMDGNKNVLDFSFQLANMMQLKTVTEGVETKEQVELINKLGGNYIQGYYYSKPIPKKDFEEYLRNGVVQ